MAKLSALEQTLLFYGTRFPNHPRKWWLHDRLRSLLKVKVDEEVEVVREGLRWLLNPCDYQHESLFWLGTNDHWDLFHARRFVAPGSLILDVGANFGYYAITLAYHLKGNCQVHAFEPNTDTFDRLCGNITANHLQRAVTAHRLGFGDAPCSASMMHRSDNSGASRVKGTGDGGEITLTSLDRFCEDQRLTRLDFVKIDVEGYEKRVLQGGVAALTRLKPTLCVELWPHGLAQEKTDAHEVVEILRSLDYRLWITHKRRLVPLSLLPTGDDPPLNVFCLQTSVIPENDVR